MKKIIILLIGLILLVGCTKNNNTNNEIEELVSWENDTTSTITSSLTKNEKNIFTKATKDLEIENLEPYTILATQVVSGTNYMYLAKNDTDWYILIIYEDLNNNASLTKATILDIEDYGGYQEDNDYDIEFLEGGWFTSAKVGKPKVTESDIYNEVSQELNKNHTLIAYLGKQENKDKSTNYAFLTLEKNDDDLEFYSVVTVTIDSEGDYLISSIRYINPEDYNQ